MGSKINPSDFDCYANALPDEPMFILLARDPSAPSLIEWWADNRESAIDQRLRPESDRNMIAEARQCAKNMRAWRTANDGKWRTPEPAPVDRTQRTLTDGSPVTPDHREIQPSGQQKAYVVLSEEERKRGFVRPVRSTYVHKKCGVATHMGRALAETYARDPKFYSGTFCCGCRTHFTFGQPDGEFTWDDGSKVGE
jgi:hypothetical protein